MIDKSLSSRIITPESLSALITQRAAHPGAGLLAGGTYTLRYQEGPVFSLPPITLSLDKLNDFRKISRNERYMELGAAVSLETIIEVGRQILPPALLSALQQIATPQVRRLATIGGNLCVPDRRMDLFPVLHLMDARLEIRSKGRPRWIPMPRLIEETGFTVFQQGEVLSRIRIPLRSWNRQIFRKGYPGHGGEGQSLIYCGLANNSRGVLSDLRVAARTSPRQVIRFKTLEADYIGRKMPLPHRERDLLLNQMQATLEDQEERVPAYEKLRILGFTKVFLEDCGREDASSSLEDNLAEG